MIFKEIRGTFGKLLMLANIILLFQCVNAFALSLTHFNITVNSTIPRYLFNFLFMQLMVAGEAFATSSLAYLALLMRYSYKSIEMSEQINKRLYKYGITYALGITLLFGFFVVTYDFGTGTYRHTLLSDGHCSYLAQSKYITMRLLHAYNYVNEIVQIFILTTYFGYYYKLNKVLKGVQKMANKNDLQLNFFVKIALTSKAILLLIVNLKLLNAIRAKRQDIWLEFVYRGANMIIPIGQREQAGTEVMPFFNYKMMTVVVVVAVLRDTCILFSVGERYAQVLVSVYINGVELVMEINSGAERTTIPWSIFQDSFGKVCDLTPTSITLHQ